MIYLFSSKAETIVRYFEANKIVYTLIDKAAFDKFVTSYEPKAGDLGVVCDFDKFISENLLQNLLVLNVHFSLLPKYRGAVPVEAAILAGETETGITIQKMVKAMDQGDILLQRTYVIKPEWYANDLQEYLYFFVPDILGEVVKQQQKEFKFSPQIGEPSYCYKKLLARENAQLRTSEISTTEFVRNVHAFNPEPVTWMKVLHQGKAKEMMIKRAEVYPEVGVRPGELQFINKRGLVIGTKNGAVLVTELVMAGSKPLRGGDIVALKGTLMLD
ncbi:hypothetical protein CO112_00610 [Candidatus Dojkabacteria bacterium CG_4_9_14_3_um_filter_150_Dojkabacteria_WS6_41_13]|uniref:Uncharacterized protein n=1 Tax=Candidatus Dojkabacteria bacterium CG_4_10_14_0_2_um_filter_Dojkabacteria_WS6_41_15 TaxID=2014249 RepID=A0A2M7W326_9BACT|nr:MAG: hypothetical protein COZ14_00495 [Candidatus Dojkabacteria bacterium CG_4_10_14_3_um_filter_Dojkabacteria_WS6_41_9]PJA15705.1 MAG: hypothetical protein COX64_00435 [Candidatus Dojkabacteria bacterium CG_4_10_14_0_2_um_filter_Dojkabacteria_WS6_41_15]PJB23561.1 MAG: hypothetical protein CO112_00610 [Candidatus Dojkabacteria bacterium CG_4_9_14_3_um_filter_150_Dojkabacteria_WS6_41_13]